MWTEEIDVPVAVTGAFLNPVGQGLPASRTVKIRGRVCEDPDSTPNALIVKAKLFNLQKYYFEPFFTRNFYLYINILYIVVLWYCGIKRFFQVNQYVYSLMHIHSQLRSRLSYISSLLYHMMYLLK